ncbi:hypothetical protein ACOTF1_26275 [Achromobacter ruhlandii]|uniref:hypothetical protein n=1 Tax=Achromobacter ruhlandii TaxID=72557 RepID=UPI003B9BE73B
MTDFLSGDIESLKQVESLPNTDLRSKSESTFIKFRKSCSSTVRSLASTARIVHSSSHPKDGNMRVVRARLFAHMAGQNRPFASTASAIRDESRRPAAFVARLIN